MKVYLIFISKFIATVILILQIALGPCCESHLVKSIQQRVEELLMSGIISHPYSLSLDMHMSALQALTSLHAVNRLKRWVITA
jgi:hypothetical protein